MKYVVEGDATTIVPENLFELWLIKCLYSRLTGNLIGRDDWDSEYIDYGSQDDYLDPFEKKALMDAGVTIQDEVLVFYR